MPCFFSLLNSNSGEIFEIPNLSIPKDIWGFFITRHPECINCWATARYAFEKFSQLKTFSNLTV